MDEEIKKLRKEIFDKNQEIDELKHKIDWIYNSRTWKLGYKVKHLLKKSRIEGFLRLILDLRSTDKNELLSEVKRRIKAKVAGNDIEMEILGLNKYVISIIIIANDEDHHALKRTILNVQNQSVRDTEIIVVCPDSKPHLWDYLCTLSENHKLKLISSNGKNSLQLFSSALENVRGMYTLPIIPGDLLEHSFINKLKLQIRKNIQPEFVIFNVNWANDHSGSAKSANIFPYGFLLRTQYLRLLPELYFDQALFNKLSDKLELEKNALKVPLAILNKQTLHNHFLVENPRSYSELGKFKIITINSFDLKTIAKADGDTLILTENKVLFRYLENKYPKRVILTTKRNKKLIEFFNDLEMRREKYTPDLSYNHKKRVFIQCDSLDKGGLEMVVYNLGKKLLESGHEVKIIITKDELGFIALRMKAEGFQIYLLNNDKNNLKELINHYRPQLVSVHHSIFGLEIYKKYDVKIQYTVHNSYTWLNQSELIERQKEFQYVDLFAMVSFEVGEYFVKKFNIPLSKIVFAPNGFDPVMFGKKKRSKKINSNKTRFLNVGSISSFKDQNIIVSLAEFFQSSHPEFEFICIGRIENPDYFKYITNRINTLKLSNIKFIDFLSPEELRGYYETSDCFLFPSIQEGWSNALLEAISFGLPIIATDTGSAKELIQNGLNGFLVANAYQDISNLNNEKIVALARVDKPSNFLELCEVIEKFASLQKDDFTLIEKIDKELASEYTNKAMCERYEIFFNQLSFGKDQDNIDNIVADLIFENPNKKIILFRPTIDWFVPIFQRPQQIALAISDTDKYLYFFSTHKGYHDQLEGLMRIDGNCYLTDKYDAIFKLNVPLVHHFLSTDLTLTRELVDILLRRGDKIIYEYIDEIHEDISGRKIPKAFLKAHEYLISNEKVSLIATADSLYDEVKHKRKSNYSLVTNGVNIQDFEPKKLALQKKPKAMLDIIASNKPIIGYYGSLAKWFDYDLIKEVAKTNKYEIVLIGYNYDGTYDSAELHKFNNIHFLGAIEYSLLANYARLFDVAVIPFLVNDITESTSPVKLFEYMALGLPIVTTNMKECRKYKSVLIGKNHSDFLNKLEEALTLKNDIDYLQLLTKEASQNSWSSKANDLLQLLD